MSTTRGGDANEVGDSDSPDTPPDATVTVGFESPAAGRGAGGDGVGDSAILARGRSVGRYVVYELLGIGGMGVVYKAYDPQLNRGVALKVLTARQSDAVDATRARARLEREAQALAQLSHPNVVAVHDVGRFDDDLFIAMELIEGQTLKQWRTAAQRRRSEIIDVFCAAGRGLAAAHRVGLVHRDFKPDNVLVGADGRVRVVDFGLARATERDEGAGGEPIADGSSASNRVSDAATGDVACEQAQDNVSAPAGDSTEGPVPSTQRGGGPAAAVASVDQRNSHFAESPLDDASRITGDASDEPLPLGRGSMVSAQLTRAGAVVGTPIYMAPEQFRGDTLDAATDQFSFCVALYEGLYGVRPFRGRTVDELKTQVLSGRVRETPASPRVPGWLRKIVLRGLSPAPADRYPSMDALLAELQAAPSARRRRWLVAAAVTSAILAALAIGNRRADDANNRCRTAGAPAAALWTAEARDAIAGSFLRSGSSLADDAVGRVQALVDERVNAWTAARRRVCEATWIRGEQSESLLDLRMHCLDRRLNELTSLVNLLSSGVDQDLVGKAVQAVFALSPADACETAMRADDAIAPPSTAADRERLASLQRRVDELEVLLAAGRYKDGVRLGRVVVAEADELSYAPMQTEALMVTSGLLVEDGDFESAERVLARGMVLAAQAKDGRRGALMAIKRMWLIGNRLDRHEEAMATMAMVEASVIRAGAEPLLRAEYQSALGSVHIARGDYAVAREFTEKALTLFESIWDDKDPRLAQPLDSLGLVLYHQRDYEASIAHFERALKIREAALGKDHPSIASTLNHIGMSYHQTNRFDEALAMYARAVSLLERAHGPLHPQIAQVLSNTGRALARTGKLKEAETHYRRALAISESFLGPKHQKIAISLGNVGHVLNQQHRYSDAVPYLRRSLAVFRTSLGDDHEYTGLAYGNLGEALEGAGQSAASIEPFERALAILEQGKSPYVADAKFALARALWRARRGNARAAVLIEQARESFLTRGNADAQLRKLDEWLRERRR